MRIPFSIPPIGGRRFDIVGFGLNSVDLVAVVAEYPVSNSKQRLQRFARLAGGPIATAMAACVRLGLRASYVGNFADDDMGAFSRASLEAAGVDIGASWTVKGAINQFSLILVDARSGERTVMWDRHPALTIDPDDVPATAVAAGRMLLADCQETAASARAARLAHAAGIPTVVDVEKVRPGIADLLQHIDVIIAAEEFPTALTGHEGLGHALQTIGRDFNAPLVAVTLGLQGSLAWCNGREIRTPGFSVDCVDSTGAGDVFRGAFVSACLRHPDGDLEDALAFANAAAALNCRALGARGALPSVDQVEALLLARPQV